MKTYRVGLTSFRILGTGMTNGTMSFGGALGHPGAGGTPVPPAPGQRGHPWSPPGPRPPHGGTNQEALREPRRWAHFPSLQGVIIDRLAGHLAPSGGRDTLPLLLKGRTLRSDPQEILHIWAQGLTQKRGLRLEGGETHELLQNQESGNQKQ